MNSPNDILQELESGNFDGLIGLPECRWLEAKESPYVLDPLKKRLELAKDVSAMANSGGGIIVIGFDTTRHPLTAGEHISRACPFPLDLINCDQYKKILGSSVYPPLNDVAIHIFENPNRDGKGVAAIFVEGAATSGRPYLVGNVLNEAGQSIGAYFGFFERKQDVIPPVNIATIQHLLSAGQQWASIHERLLAIETNMNSWGAAQQAANSVGITDKERSQRIKDARISVGRDDSPVVYFMASTDGECDFPTLFKSRRERVVRLIENPPQLREQGFEIWADYAAEIIQGRLRRNMIAGHRLIELWKDGLFIYVAPGDEDFLGWRLGSSENPVRINNFVLAESILVFCWLMRFVFEEADPKPSAIRLAVGFESLTRASGPAILSSVPEGSMPYPFDSRSAPAPDLEVVQRAELVDYDAERLGFLLMEKIYHWFGFDSASVPYIDREGANPKLSAAKIIGNPLPESVETPGFN